ncbi:MAG: MarR family winged helix-turn-helix transcriptional regulator [Rhodospirillaceae bacterium]
MSHDNTPKSDLALQAIEVCLCFHTRKASRAITQIFDKLLAPTGLKATQLSLLMVVNSRGPIRIGELSDALVSDSTTLSRTIKPLLKSGFISQSPSSEDGRIKLIELTAEGAVALDQALPLWQQAQSLVAKKLGGETVQNMLTALEKASYLGPANLD